MKDFKPKVSIIIPVYNGSNYLKEAIDSALAQTYKNVEILVINDGSSDMGKTEQICKSYGNKIRYFKKENGGVASALNLGIEEMKGEYFSWLSHDDVYYPEKIEKQIEFFNRLDENSQKKSILYSDYNCVDNKGDFLYKVDLLKGHGFINLNDRFYLLSCGCLNGCTLLIPKICFQKFGNFDEKLLCTQDYDLWSRLIIGGVRFLYVKGATVKSRQHENQTSIKYLGNQLECNKLWQKILKEVIYKEKSLSDRERYDFIENTLPLLVENNYETALSFYKKEKKLLIDKLSKKITNGAPLVSVIIPSYNQGEYLEEAISSLLKQKYKNLEVIVVDDGSDDATVEILKKISNPKVKIFFNKHCGRSATRNFGIRKSTGAYIQFLDSDDYLINNKILRNVKFLQNNPRVDVVYSNFKFYYEETQKYDFPERKSLELNSRSAFEDFINRWQRPISIPIHCFLFRKECFDKSQFEKKLDVGEDWYLWLSLAKEKRRFFFDDFIGCVYRIHRKSTCNDKVGSFYNVLKTIAHIRSNLIDKDLINWFDSSMALYIEYLVLVLIIQPINSMEVNEQAYSFTLSSGSRLQTQDLHQRICELENRINELEKSKSWKLTKPLRDVTTFFVSFKK